ncbi:MAG: hypothetical protein U0401_00775 [Anaerolineae bacterium]
MAKIKGPLFSMGATGSFGDIVFDRRGYAYLKPERRDAQSPDQGDARQAMAVAQKCARVCGEVTRQQLKARAADPAHWGAYLSGKLVGPQRSRFMAALEEYTASPEVGRAGWEAEAQSLGLQEVLVPYAHQSAITPGAQLFALATTLFGLGMYSTLGQPNGNAAAWKDSISS